MFSALYIRFYHSIETHTYSHINTQRILVSKSKNTENTENTENSLLLKYIIILSMFIFDMQ